MRICTVVLILILLLISKIVSAQEQCLFIDERDSKIYKAVKIREQTWMAENFNFEVANSWCYYDKSEYCTKFGRLYSFESIKDACPTGWHLPGVKEWETLITNLGGFKTAGYQIINGGNSGFNILMGGIKETGGKYNLLYDFGIFWTSTERQDSANVYLINLNKFSIHPGVRIKSDALSVRFLKNDDDEPGDFADEYLTQIIDHFLPEMEAAAKNKAESVHSLSAIEYCTGEKYVIINQASGNCEVEKIFNVFMKGSLLGLKKFKVEISIISSFEKKGKNIWRPLVKYVRVVSDTKIK